MGSKGLKIKLNAQIGSEWSGQPITSMGAQRMVY